MPLLVHTCPRCAADHMTFDVQAVTHRGRRHGWQEVWEAYSVCRRCRTGSILKIETQLQYRKEADKFLSASAIMAFKDDLGPIFRTTGFVGLADNAAAKPPDYIPGQIEQAFREGATCNAIGCYNASATMFRLCVDLATKPLLPDKLTAGVAQPNEKARRDLGLRLQWLFENGRLPDSLREIAKCIREDANDGAHAGNLTEADADDLGDFTTILLERLYTEPKRIELAAERREQRRRPT